MRKLFVNFRPSDIKVNNMVAGNVKYSSVSHINSVNTVIFWDNAVLRLRLPFGIVRRILLVS
ncbi:hypothetical protein DSUL_60294 [Desulfovibrionales bacterium]